MKGFLGPLGMVRVGGCWYVLVVLGGFCGFGLCIHFSMCLMPSVLGMDQYIDCGMAVYK